MTEGRDARMKERMEEGSDGRKERKERMKEGRKGWTEGRKG